MRYLKQFTFYPGEWAPSAPSSATVVADGCLNVQLDVGAIWDVLELPGETGCDLIEEEKYDEARNKIAGLEDEIGVLAVKIEELDADNKELDALCTHLEDENETLKEQIATLLEKLNGK